MAAAAQDPSAPSLDRDAAAHVAAHELGLDAEGAARLVDEAQAALAAGDAATASELLARAGGALQRLQGSIEQLLIDRGGSLDELCPEPTNVAAMIDRVVASHPTRDHHVDVDASPVLISLDPVKVERILDNLLANALLHTPSGCSVRVRASARPGGVKLVVEDDGPGLPEEARKAIFDADHRFPPNLPGSEMGLWIVARFARLHGGDVAVTTVQTGRGARFEVLLPAVTQH